MPISRERVALYESLALLTNVLHCWMKVRPERLTGTVVALQRHLLDRDRLMDWDQIPRPFAS